MEQAVKSTFVGDHTLKEIRAIQDAFVLEGQIACKGGIVIDVGKKLEVMGRTLDGDYIVMARTYRYNAYVRNVPKSTFLRFDNAHVQPGHHDKFHRHDYNWRTGKQLPGSPSWIGFENWPTLANFIDVVEVWYDANVGDLPNPHGYPTLGSRSDTEDDVVDDE